MDTLPEKYNIRAVIATIYRSRYPNSYLVFEVTKNAQIADYFIMLDVCPATENETGNLNLKHKKGSETNLTPLSHIHPL